MTLKDLQIYKMLIIGKMNWKFTVYIPSIYAAERFAYDMQGARCVTCSAGDSGGHALSNQA